MLVPFKFQPPQVELRVLDKTLKLAPSAFPKLLEVGKWLDGIGDDVVSEMRQKVQEQVDGGLVSRLATQYTLGIMVAQEVSVYLLFMGSCQGNKYMCLIKSVCK